MALNIFYKQAQKTVKELSDKISLNLVILDDWRTRKKVAEKKTSKADPD